MEKKPDANGVTYGVLDDSRQKECYAEIGMVDTNDDSKWKSCIFGGKIIYSTIQFDGVFTKLSRSLSWDPLMLFYVYSLTI